VGRTPLALYAPGVGAMGPAGAAVRELDLVANARPPRFTAPPPPPGFRAAGGRRTESWQLVRYVASAPVPVGPHGLVVLGLQRDKAAIVLVQRPGPG
jgi:hypothetical protein